MEGGPPSMRRQDSRMLRSTSLGSQSLHEIITCGRRCKATQCPWWTARIVAFCLLLIFAFGTWLLFFYRNYYFNLYSGEEVQFFVQTEHAVQDYSAYLRQSTNDDVTAYLDNSVNSACPGAAVTMREAIIYLSRRSKSLDSYDDDRDDDASGRNVGLRCNREFDDDTQALDDYGDDADDADNGDDAFFQTTTAHIKCSNDTSTNTTKTLQCLFEQYFSSGEGGVNHCSVEEIEMITLGQTDTASCGISSTNEQGCLAGFYQPQESESTVPAAYTAAKPCPDGFFCPEDFTCATPCPWGAACLRSQGGVNETCTYPYALDLKTSRKQTIYNQSTSYCFRNSNDHRFVCPGATGISLCPAGSYCPNPTAVIDCPKYYYCPAGSYEPVKCQLGAAVCDAPNIDYPPVLKLFVEVGVGIFAFAALIWKLASTLHTQVRVRRREMQLAHITQRVEARERVTEQVAAARREVLQVAVDAEVSDPLGMCCGFSFVYHVATFSVALVCFIIGVAMVSIYRAKDKDVGETAAGFLFIIISVPMLLFGGVGSVLIMAASGNGLVGALQLEKKHAARIEDSRQGSIIGHLGSNQMLGAIKVKTRTRVNIEVQQLGLKLHSNGAMVLAGVNGKLNSGKVTALMGPSGAGKTTFLNTLSGRATYGDVTGKVLLNGERRTINSISSIVGFVPQDDVMHRELTVREVLKFYARMRLPRHLNADVQERMVQDVVEALGLIHIVDSAIGDEAKRGISGGQRKRVNVAMEMVGDPSLLFLDEPTSGLDSTTSYELVSALSKLASKGVNVIAVLHQPSYQLYAMFDNVLLLGNGGRTVYLGDSKGALGYFQSLGFELPHMMNPADFMMDVIAGKCERKNFPDFHKTDLFDLWESHRVTFEGQAAKSFVAAEPLHAVDIQANEGAGFLPSTVIFINRAALQYTKTLNANMFDICLCIGTGVFLGIAYPNVELYTGPTSFLMYSFGLSLDIGLTTLRVFGDEKLIFWREASPGAGMDLSAGAFFLAKTLVELPRIFILTAVNVFCFVAFAKPLCNFGKFLGMSFVCSWAVSGLAVLYSIALDAKSAQLVLVISLLVFLLYGGIETLLSKMDEGQLYFSMLSPNRWLVEDLSTCNSAALPASYRLPYTWYVDGTDSAFAVLYKLMYSEQLMNPVQTQRSTRNTAAASFWLYSEANNVTNTGATLMANQTGVDLNSFINFWLGLVFRMLAFLVMQNTNREKMGKLSYFAILQKKVINPAFDWVTRHGEGRHDGSTNSSSGADVEQMNPVHAEPTSNTFQVDGVENDHIRHDDAMDLRERGLTGSSASTNDSRPKASSFVANADAV